jgi:hypothetical protein
LNAAGSRSNTLSSCSISGLADIDFGLRIAKKTRGRGNAVHRRESTAFANNIMRLACRRPRWLEQYLPYRTTIARAQVPAKGWL